MGQALEGMAEGMAEIEQRALALLGLVGDDDARLGGATCGDRIGPRRTAGKDFAPAGLQEFKERPIADQAVLDHFRIARAELPLAQRVEAAGIGENEGRLMERPDEIFSVRRVDAGLAADARIDLRQERGRDLDEPHAASQRGCAEAGQIANDPAAERDHDVASFDARRDQRVGDAREFGIGLRRLAGRADDRCRGEPGFGEACLHPAEIERRDMSVGDDRTFGPGRDACDFQPSLVDHAAADDNRVGARAERHLDLSPFRRDQHPGAAQLLGEAAQRHVDHRLVRPVAPFDGDVGERIDWRAFLQQLAQGPLRVGGLQKGAVRFLAHARQQHLDVRLQPNRDAVRGDVVARRLVHEGAAPGRQHLWSRIQQARDHLPLPVAEIGFAEPLEDFGDRQLRARLDLGVGVDERQPELRGEPLADRRLAGAHHAHEHDRAAPKRGRNTPGVDGRTLNHQPRTSPFPLKRRPLQESQGVCDREQARCAHSTVLRGASVLATMPGTRPTCDRRASRTSLEVARPRLRPD